MYAVEGITNAASPGNTEKNKKRKNDKNKKGTNERLRLEGKAYKTKKGKEIPAVPPPEFVPCKWKNKCRWRFEVLFIFNSGASSPVIKGGSLLLVLCYHSRKSK